MAELTNKQKVAILLLSLGADTASDVLKYLEDYQIEEIAREISRLDKVEPEIVNATLKEFHQFLLNEIGAKSGMGYLKEVLERTLGSTKAMALINRLSELQPFTYLKDMSVLQLASILAKEHPQTIAVVLSYIPPAQAAGVFSHLPEEAKLAVALRIANAKYVEAETISEVNKALEKTVLAKKGMGPIAMGESGTRTLAEILNRTDIKTETAVLEGIQQQNNILAEEVRKQMFLFSDIKNLEDRTLQRVIREVDSKDLTLSLKLADESVKDKIFKNMSERARDILKEEMSFLGPVRIRQVEEAQQRILETIRRLEQAGEIELPKPGVEEKFV